MPDLRDAVSQRFRPAFGAVEPDADPVVRWSDRADLQVDGVLALAKRLQRNPRELAQEIVATVELDDLCSTVEVSGPGFVNLTLRTDAIAAGLAALSGDERLGVELAESPEVVVIDYSAPNVAKEMHVGHLRSTIIGDSLVRTLSFLGHEVIRENHIGDWGTPFGMLIEHLTDLGETEAAAELSVGDLNNFYQEARRKFDGEPGFAERARSRVVALQAGDPDTLRLWELLVAESAAYFSAVYQRLGVLLTDEDSRGESAYNDMLVEIVDDLDNAGLLVTSDGARCVFPAGFTNRDNEPLPLIVQKADGGYGYAVTDLATVRDRVDRLKATLLLYCVGAPQAQHFQMVWTVAAMVGWMEPPVRAVHVANGSVLGGDGKLLRTRSGGSVRLSDLLDEAVARARAVLDCRGGTPDGIDTDNLARQVGIGALKYADLSIDRLRDYQFDWDKMLAFDGNTAPYLQYACARIQSIFAKDEAATIDWRDTRPDLGEDPERALALKLLDFEPTLTNTIEGFAPHRLCTYLYELASAFTRFYESCPVLRGRQEQQPGRLLICDLTLRTLRLGLTLLGIETPTKM